MSEQNIIGTLQNIDIFEGLTPVQTELVAFICERLTYRKGEVLFNERDASHDIYIIEDGKVEILMLAEGEGGTSLPIVIAELQSGQLLGELALLDQGVRSASARIASRTAQLLRIARPRLMLICDSYPDLGYRLMRNLAVDLVAKVRNADLNIRQYQAMLATQRKRRWFG